jgi:DNA-directed RNA polymerase subunit K/omega
MEEQFNEIDDDVYVEPDGDDIDLDNDDDDNSKIPEAKAKIKPKKEGDDEDDDEDDEIDEDSNYDNIAIIDDADDNDNSTYEHMIAPEDRITSQYMYNYEFVKLVGIRATQISQGSRVFCKVDNLTDPLKIAEKELYDNKCPLSIKRYIRPGVYEIWTAQELIKRRFI